MSYVSERKTVLMIVSVENFRRLWSRLKGKIKRLREAIDQRQQRRIKD